MRQFIWILLEFSDFSVIMSRMPPIQLYHQQGRQRFWISHLQNRKIDIIMKLSAFLFIFISLFCSKSASHPSAVQGKLDFRNIPSDFFESETVPLNGEWEFYQDTHIPVSGSEFKSHRTYEKIPSNWTSYQKDGKTLPPFGLGSFRLKILLKEKCQEMGIRIFTFGTSYSMYADGHLISKNGHPGKTKEDTVPEYFPRIVRFKCSSSEIDLLIHVSNFHYRTGGFWRNIYLGKPENLENVRYNENISDLILCGMLFTMGIYHFGIFFLRRSESAALHFGLFCIFLIFYNMTINDIFLKQIFPKISFRLLLIIHCFSFTIPIPSMSLFVKRMFPDDFYSPVLYLIYAVTGAASAAILIFPTEIFSQIVQPMRFMIIVSSVYLIYLLARSSLKGNFEAKVFLLGFMIFFISVGNDILRANHILNTEYLSSWGFMFFIIAQSFVLSRRSSEAFRLSGTLTKELFSKNITLEQKNQELRILKSSLEDMVADRTKELLAAKENAELAANARYRFLANMSHEIRTPLNSIIGLTDLLLEAELKSEERDMAETVNSSGKLLLRIINDILDLSKIESGKIDLEETDFNLSFLTAEISSMINPLIKSSGKNIRFYHLIDPEIPNILHGDPFRLKQILLNLLSNSVKFTEAGEIRFETRLISSGMKTYNLEFTVTDTGIGMNDSEIKKIFEPFVQADSSTTRKYGGTGLGLVIVRRLTESMGGRAFVESEKGKGSVFSLTIPFVKSVTASEINLSEPVRNEKLHSLYPFNILLVEDNKANQKLIERILEKEGYKIITADNGQDCLDILEKEKIDMIFMDYQMPVMDGPTASAEIRKKYNDKFIIIALTANVLEEDKKVCRDSGMDDFISKPARPYDLREKISLWGAKKFAGQSSHSV